MEEKKKEESKDSGDERMLFEKYLKELKSLAAKDGPQTGEEIVQRLISDTFLNPYDVLMIGPEASDDEIKKKFKEVIIIS